MKKLINYVVALIKSIWSKFINLFKKKKMNINFENEFLDVLINNANEGLFSNTLKISRYKQNEIEEFKINIKFEDDTNMILLINFNKDRIIFNVDNINNQYNLLDLKNNIDSIFNVIDKSTNQLYAIYRKYKR